MNRNSFYEEFKTILKSGNAFYPLLQNLLPPSLLSRNMKVDIYRNLIVPVVLYGCETWSLTTKEDRKLRVFENMVLSRIFLPKREEVTWEWRRLHTGELNDLCCSLNIIRVIKSRRMGWVGHVARIGDSRCANKVLVGRHEGKRPVGRLGRHRR